MSLVHGERMGFVIPMPKRTQCWMVGSTESNEGEEVQKMNPRASVLPVEGQNGPHTECESKESNQRNQASPFRAVLARRLL